MGFASKTPKQDREPRSDATYDRSRLDDVCHGNEELRKRILVEYVKTTPAAVERLVEQMIAGNIDEARHIAHGLKGSSRTIGATTLGDLCQSLEGQWANATKLAIEIRAEFERLKLAIEQHIGPN